MMFEDACDFWTDPDQQKNIRYILSPTKSCSCLHMNRPIQKESRSRKTQVLSVASQTLFLLVVAYHSSFDSIETSLIEIIYLTSYICFLVGSFFYVMVLINPGYVAKQRNFIGLIERLLEENIKVDYLCVYCENLRPESALHCNHCNRCVEKFDHHCIFVNNCLGYRNHKYFLLFLMFFSFYMVTVLVHATW